MVAVVVQGTGWGGREGVRGIQVADIHKGEYMGENWWNL